MYLESRWKTTWSLYHSLPEEMEYALFSPQTWQQKMLQCRSLWKWSHTDGLPLSLCHTESEGMWSIATGSMAWSTMLLGSSTCSCRSVHHVTPFPLLTCPCSRCLTSNVVCTTLTWDIPPCDSQRQKGSLSILPHIPEETTGRLHSAHN
jgi:hypothetical protein